MTRILAIVLIISIFSCQRGQQRESNGNITTGWPHLNPVGIPDSLIVKGAYLVTLREDVYEPILANWNDSSAWVEGEQLQLQENKIAAIQSFASSKGFVVQKEDIFVYTMSGFLTEGETVDKMARLLMDTSEVASIEPDFFMQNTRARMQGDSALLQNSREQLLNNPNWGYDAVDYTSKAIKYLGGGIPNSSSRNKIWIIDSGIDSEHQDLRGQIGVSLSDYFIKPIGDPSDKNPFYDHWGHGTSCAGLAAAKPFNRTNNPTNDSLIGMTGMSPGAKLVSLKIFGVDSLARFSWIKKAVEHVGKSRGAIRGDVVSMSLAGLVNNCANYGLKTQIEKLSKKGIYIVMAAGNGPDFQGMNASGYLPACIDGEKIFTIGSMDLDFITTPFRESFSAFSNYGGPPIDWLTPGNFVFTIFPGNRYAVMSGTSMSAPLFAGLLHLTNGQPRKKTEIQGIHGESQPYPVPMR